MNVAMITGAGQLASALARFAPEYGWTPRMCGRDVLDITQPSQVHQQVEQLKPSLIFHTAALTRVNYCEGHREEAFQVNSEGTANVVAAAREVDARLIYFSTDYVFDGTKQGPWVESDEPNAVNVYGASKFLGEEHVRAYPQGHVVRTSGVFGPRTAGQPERNFFQAIIHKLSTGQPVEVVTDQRTCVTYTHHLAELVFELLSSSLPTIVHLTSSGVDSWYGWAQQAAIAAGYEPAQVIPIMSAKHGSPVVRPANCELASIHDQASALMACRTGAAGLRAYVAKLQTG